jgi:amidohydrolase
MIEGGALEGVAAIAGLHVGSICPDLPKGCFGTRKGTLMASATFFTVTFHGRGAHGATPDQGADALLAACQFAAALQTVRYGAASPVHPTVLSLGSIHAGSAANVIPEEAVLTGTMRTTSLEDLAAMNRKLDLLARGVALAHGVEVRVDAALRAPLTANTDSALVDLLAAAVAAAHGPESFRWLAEPTLMGEDFGAFLERVPGVFFFLGTNPGGSTAPHHHPRFEVAEEELPKPIAVVEALLRLWTA